MADHGKPASGLRFGGIVLAGGQSRRMGRPKAWLPVAGRTMLENVVDAVEGGLAAARDVQEARDDSHPIVVVGAPGQELPVLPDRIHHAVDEVEGEGPLRGMAAGFEALSGQADAAFVSSCDTPLLKPAFIMQMLSLLGDHDIAVPMVEGRHHPLAAVYRLTVLDHVRDLLSHEKRRPFFLFERVKTRVVEPEELRSSDPGLDSLRNFNTPDEYQALVERLGFTGPAAGPAGGAA